MKEEAQEKKDDTYECFTFSIYVYKALWSFPFSSSSAQETGSDMTICYFIISVLFSIGNHNIHCTKQKFIFGISRTSCIFRMHCAWNLKVRFSHHFVSLSTHLFHFIILWCFLLHSSNRDLLTSYVTLEWCMCYVCWRVCMRLSVSICVCMCIFVCLCIRIQYLYLSETLYEP